MKNASSSALTWSCTSARVGAGRSCCVWDMWAASLPAMCLTLGWDRHDLAGLERMAHVCGTTSLLHPYGMTVNATCWRALLLV